MRALIAWGGFAPADGWQIAAPIAEHPTATALLGPELSAPAPFAEAVPSWIATTPPGTWIEIQLRARLSGRWTKFYRIAQWDTLPASSRRCSFGEQRDEDGHVATDTLSLCHPAEAIQPRVLLFREATGHPELRALRLALSGPAPRRAGGPLAPQELPIPPRSQMAYPGGDSLCSPTALAMLLAYWHARANDPGLAPFADPGAVADVIAPQVFDPVYDGHGNWGFNTAFAASCGLDAYVARFADLASIEPWVAAGVPLAISVAWKEGELANAPIPASRGHLLVVAGFADGGRVIVAEPRAEHVREVRRLYDAAQIERAWQDNSAGTAYVVHPHGWPIPRWHSSCFSVL